MTRCELHFEYQALHHAESIRVIELFPALNRDKPIIINLLESLPNSPFHYEALSYTWDDQTPTRDIICNEASLRVTDNVFQALRQLRSGKGQRRNLWIDAICINQKDQAEKTSQVSMMGNIYARADRVNVWLSRSTEAMRALFEYVRLSTGSKLSFDRVSDACSRPEGRTHTNIIPSLLDQGVDCARSRTQQELLDLPRSTQTPEDVGIWSNVSRCRGLREPEIRGNHPTTRGIPISCGV